MRFADFAGRQASPRRSRSALLLAVACGSIALPCLGQPLTGVYGEGQQQHTRSIFRVFATVNAPDYTVSSATASGVHHLTMKKDYHDDNPTNGSCPQGLIIGEPYPVSGSPINPLDVLVNCSSITPSTPDCSATLIPYSWTGGAHAGFANIIPQTSGIQFSADKMSWLQRFEYRGTCINSPCTGAAPKYLNYCINRVQSTMHGNIPVSLTGSGSTNKLELQFRQAIENDSERNAGCPCTYDYGLGDCAEKIAFCMTVTYHGTSSQVSSTTYNGILTLAPWGVDTITGFFLTNQATLDIQNSSGVNSGCSNALERESCWSDESDADVVPDFIDSPSIVNVDLNFPAFTVASIDVDLAVDLATVAATSSSPTNPAPSPWGSDSSVPAQQELLSFDFDGDGSLTNADRWGILTLAVNSPCAAIGYDTNGDGVVDGRDLPCPSSLYGCFSDVGVAGGGPGQDGVVDNNDDTAFFNMYFNHDPRADLGRAGGLDCPDGMWNNNDIIVFYNHYFDPC